MNANSRSAAAAAAQAARYARENLADAGRIGKWHATVGQNVPKGPEGMSTEVQLIPAVQGMFEGMLQRSTWIARAAKFIDELVDCDAAVKQASAEQCAKALKTAGGLHQEAAKNYVSGLGMLGEAGAAGAHLDPIRGFIENDENWTGGDADQAAAG